MGENGVFESEYAFVVSMLNNFLFIIRKFLIRCWEFIENLSFGFGILIFGIML